MADTIKSLTVKIGADTSDFTKALKSVDKEIATTTKTANSLQKGLELEFDESRFTASQKAVQKALTTTEAKAEAIREQLKYLEEHEGVDSVGYEKLTAELAKAETQAITLKEKLEDVKNIKVETVTSKVDKLSSSLSTAAKNTAALSTAAVAAIAAITSLTTSAAATGAEIADTSTALGLSAEAWQEWSYYALQSGTDASTLETGLTKLNDALGTLAAGETSTATEALETLLGEGNVPTDTEDAMLALMEAIQGIEDSTLQAYYANELFGTRVGTSLIPLLNQSTETLAGLNEEFESIGYLTDEQVDSLADFDDKLNEVSEQWSLLTTELGLALIPLMEKFIVLLDDYIVPAVEKLTLWFENLSDESQDLVVNGLLLVAALSPVLLIMSSMVSSVSKLITGFSNLTTGLNSLAAHPVILALIAIAAIIAILYASNEDFRESINALVSTLGQALSPILELVTGLLTDIFDLITPIINLLVDILIPILDTLTAILQPVVAVLEYIIGLISKVINGILSIFGKGWLWGTSDSDSSTSSADSSTDLTDSLATYSSYDYSSLTTDSSTSGTTYSEDNSEYNITIELSGTGVESYDTKTIADEVIAAIVLAKQSKGV